MDVILSENVIVTVQNCAVLTTCTQWSVEKDQLWGQLSRKP